MDFNFFIQNFTLAQFGKTVKPEQESTVAYTFFPADVFAGRPLGLQINLMYHDAVSHSVHTFTADSLAYFAE